MTGPVAKSRLAGIALLVSALAFLPACSRETAETPAPPVQSDAESASAELPTTQQAGERLATSLCAGCHAIGLQGESPHADAPPFRTLSEKYPVRFLEEALAEGIMVGHEDMPEFQLEADQVEQLVVYLESIQAQ
ncbi:MAG: c-type cytochrome [Hyphomonas sp.]